MMGEAAVVVALKTLLRWQELWPSPVVLLWQEYLSFPVLVLLPVVVVQALCHRCCCCLPQWEQAQVSLGQRAQVSLAGRS